MFRPPERRCRTTPLHAIEYQCVAMRIFTLKICPKITVFRSFLILRARHKIAIPHLPKPQNADETKRTNRLVKQKQIKPLEDDGVLVALDAMSTKFPEEHPSTPLRNQVLR